MPDLAGRQPPASTSSAPSRRRPSSSRRSRGPHRSAGACRSGPTPPSSTPTVRGRPSGRWKGEAAATWAAAGALSKMAIEHIY
eukprot:10890959-Alexandrium_andersonii.AAC.1